MRPERIHDAFPAPGYRGNQREALDDIRDAFEEGARVVLVCAPTGSGKSLLARAICGCARRADEEDATRAAGAYYTTPQVSQLDAVAADPLLEDVSVIRGKRNYRCILPGETDTPVDRAPCARIDGYDCDRVHRCPYFSDRSIASNRQIAGMTLAYFMQTAGSTVFGPRDVVVIDEAHGLASWAELYATIEVSGRTVPFWSELDVPTVEDDLPAAARFAENILRRARGTLEEFAAQESLTEGEVATRDRLEDLVGELQWFHSACQDPSRARNWIVDQQMTDEGEPGSVRIKPLEPGRFLSRTVWDRGEHFALLSATILDKDGFCRRVGLDPSEVRRIEVPHTFPLEHRRLFDATVGKMTMTARERTLPALGRTVASIMATHSDEKGIVHCHSYAIQAEIEERLHRAGLGDRLAGHSRANRDAALDAWKSRADASVFLSVKMEEALDLDGELARWQVLCKAPFPNAGDASVATRLERGEWDWYYRTTLRTIIQACGRVVRSPEDYGSTYILDESILEVFERTRDVMPDWFEEQVAAMGTPELDGSVGETVTKGSAGQMNSTSPSAPDPQPDNSTGGHPLRDVWDG